MDDEEYWPWFTPAMFENFYELMDDPGNWPVLAHCLGGRHRTGTFSALFRLEYDRWPVADVLREMYAFDFGDPAPIHEHNLRTYLPRPLPDPAQWAALQAELSPVAEPAAIHDYPGLVRYLKSVSEPERLAAIERYLTEDRPFAVCLAQWLIDRSEHPLADVAAKLADRHVQTSSQPATLASAAALVADYGSPEQQQRLLGLLASEARSSEPSWKYEALVEGVTNRYTPNRIAYLTVLLNDIRQRRKPGLSAYRYCDTATMRLTSIVNEPLHDGTAEPAAWERAVVNCRHWIEAHPEEARLSTLLPPLPHARARNHVARETDGRPGLR
jgi:hypothetical protein